ncbi:MAG: sugar phosphate nucleotidyltransferase [Methanococcaceae archaeon]
MIGIIPAAGSGSRIQPLAFSKELLPVGSRFDGTIERPKAVSEYLIERMILAGADKISIIISPGKSDIIEYYAGSYDSVHFSYTVQQHPKGLCDSIFSALPLVHPDEEIIIGLPDTIWFPEDGLQYLPDGILSFLLFPVEHPELFDSVLYKNEDVVKIEVKQKQPSSSWIWGAFKMPEKVFRELYKLWCDRNRSDEYFGTLVNAYLKSGGRAKAVPRGESYVDVGTLNGYREAIILLASKQKARADETC